MATLVTIPVNGASDVPRDAKLWVLNGNGSKATLIFLGKEIEGIRETPAWTSFQLPPLKSGSTHGFSVDICADHDGCTSKRRFGPYYFGVGADTSVIPERPKLLNVSCIRSEGSNSFYQEGRCENLILKQDCFDAHPYSLYRVFFKVNPVVSHYSIRSAISEDAPKYIFPASCPAEIMADEASCFRVIAYSMNGAASEEVTFCVDSTCTAGCQIGSMDAEARSWSRESALLSIIIFLLFLAALRRSSF